MDELLLERYNLSKGRLGEIINEDILAEELKSYFDYLAKLLLKLCEIAEGVNNVDISILKRWNAEVYDDILEANYDKSYANPEVLVRAFGEERGKLFSALSAEMRSVIPYAFEEDYDELIIRMELLLEMYGAVCDELEYKQLRDIIYWYVSDYSDVESLKRVKELVDPTYDFALNIIEDSDLTNPDYLYRYGEYITANEIRLASYVASLDEEMVVKIADTYTEGYRIGFIATGKDLSIKSTVNIRYPLGMERIVKVSIKNFEKMGLKPVIYRAGNSLFRRQGMHKVGYYGANPNKQYDFDHREDEAVFLDGNFVTRKLECLEAAFNEYKELAYGHAGPAVIESFGENDPDLKSKDSANALNEKQQKLQVRHASEAGRITNEYIKGEERSFTIIAFPVPDIGDDFEKIFEETIRINTLDYKLYQGIQQTIIDCLDTGDYAHIKGMNGNRTNLKVNLYKLKDPSKETIFENCVADVNIPVGEVFTSPVLKNTNGILHVSQVYLNGLEYKDLEIEVKDGMVADYNCANFDTEDKNKKYIKDNVLFHHESLPMGEFAIGTNTTAYVVGRKYDIQAKLPILIAEKTGPHFAFGDTCYSHEEDIVTYNPDGKAIVARENEVSALRKEDISKAYLNCHTDITIPYDELGFIDVYDKEGNSIRIIDKGRFVLPGTEQLNDAFDAL